MSMIFQTLAQCVCFLAGVEFASSGHPIVGYFICVVTGLWLYAEGGLKSSAE